MELKERFQRALEVSRGLVEELIRDIAASDAWFRPAAEGTNHAMWIVGHLAAADDAFVGLVDPAASDPRDSFRKCFGRGSELSLEPSDYPPIDEVLDYLRDRRAALLAALEKISADDFEKPTPPGAPPIMYDLGSVFHMAAWHESLHAGQLTTIRRMLGHAPIR